MSSKRLGSGDAERRARLEELARRITVEGSRERRPVRAPFTGQVLGRIPECTAADVEAAAVRGRMAQASWRRRGFRERSRIFRRFHDLVLKRQDEALDLIQLESGKARRHAFEEIADAALVSRYYAYHGGRHLRSRRRRGAFPGLTATREDRVPLGVVGIISPWNYPLTLAVSDAIPALLAGNAVVLKPDPQVSFTALWAAELLSVAGLPPDLLNLVTGDGPRLGPPLIDAVDFLSFTGSTETGRLVARRAAERLIPCSLELGGKNAMIVLGDADLGLAVKGAVRGCFSNAGQLCLSIERLYVAESVYGRFRERFVERTRALRLGSKLTYEADVGSLISREQLDRVEAHVADAVGNGARVLAGGRTRPDVGPLFYEPTVLEGVTPEMRTFREETFGPVVALRPVASLDEAVRLANCSPYGLNASVWTRDAALARGVADRLEAGTVNLNEAYAAAWASVDAPMGGFKDSGLGRRHGAEGILKYTESRTVASQRLLPLAPPPGMEARRYAALVSRMLRVLARIPLLR
ncbi:MAG: succinic semialdehyde dehydrogenase [Gemmatimonadota bacterium]